MRYLANYSLKSHLDTTHNKHNMQ